VLWNVESAILQDFLLVLADSGGVGSSISPQQLNDQWRFDAQNTPIPDNIEPLDELSLLGMDTGRETRIFKTKYVFKILS
jgi:hypothetical protein